MLEETLSGIAYYDWLLLALFILIVEMLTGTFYLFWLGLAALATGALQFFIPSLSWQAQLVVFSLVSVVSMIAWTKYAKKKQQAEDSEDIMNQRGHQYVGQSYPLIEAIENGTGVVNIDDTRWTVRGAPKAEGEMVTIKAVDGNILEVE